MTAGGSEGIAVANIHAAFGQVEDVTPAVDVALGYAAHGLHVLPIIPGEKRPVFVQWPNLATVDPDTVRRWWTVDYKRYGIGIAPRQLPDGGWLFVVDVDDNEAKGKHGSETLADLEATYGPLPATWTVLSGGGGRHLYFRSPDEIRNGKTGRLGDGIDVRGNGGQTVAPPTIHKDTGRPYMWEHGHEPGEVPLADAPDWLIALLAVDETKRAPTAYRSGDYLGDSPADRYNRETSWPELLEADGWTWSHATKDGVDHWTRPGKHVRQGTSATVGYAGLDILRMFSSSVAWLPERAYTRFRYYAHRHHDGNMSDAARTLAARYGIEDDRKLAAWLAELDTEKDVADLPHPIDDPEPESDVADLPHPIDDPKPNRGGADLHQAVDRAPLAGDKAPERPTLSDDFWNSTPTLRHIRQAARSRLVAPTALLGHVLAYVSAYTPPTYCVPPYIGGHTPLSLFVAQVAQSGGGKSSPARVVDELLPTLPTVYSLGSGEGLIETYLEEVEERVDGKKIRRKQQTKFGAVFHLDEGAALADMGDRKGSTIFPTLRSAWMGAPLGTANASQDTRRQLDAAAYALGVTFLFQPSKARPLFDDIDGGLPQRFLFIDPYDPDAPDIDPDWPGPLPWTPKALCRIDGRTQHHPLTYPDHVGNLIRTERKQANRGQLKVDPLDAHRNLHRLKLAGLFAILDDNRSDVTDDDWTLAGTLLDYSDAVRSRVLKQLAAEDTNKENAATAKAVKRNRVLQDDEEHRAREAAIRAVARKASANIGQTLTRSELHRAVASKHRQHVNMDDVIAEAVKRGHLAAAVDDRYSVGAKPL